MSLLYIIEQIMRKQEHILRRMAALENNSYVHSYPNACDLQCMQLQCGIAPLTTVSSLLEVHSTKEWPTCI